MDKVAFECRNCGRTMEKDILPTKHAVLGTVTEINRTATCCRKPDYEDEEGFQRSRQKSVRFVPDVA